MKMLFLPATPKGDLRLLDEAIGIALTGHPVTGVIMHQHSDGSTGKMFKAGVNFRSIGWPQTVWRARASIHEALKAAEIAVLVQSRETGAFYRVPRSYWLRHEPTESVLKLTTKDAAGADHLDDQPLLVEIAQQEAWDKAAYRHRQTTKSSPPSREARGTLPARAAKGDKLHEAAAHAAAEMVRLGSSIEAAATSLIDTVEAKNRQPASIVRAIRRCFDLMYDNRGNPLN